VYSAVALKGIIPENDLRCWLLFVRACTILFARIISEQDVFSADYYLVAFCKKFETLYGQERCTANRHLHLHLKNCLLDYGPVHGFWCFPFERFNGILGAYHTNNKAVESQILKKVLHEQAIARLDLPTELIEDFSPIYQKMSTKTKGSLKETAKVENLRLLQSTNDFGSTDFSLKSSAVQVVPPVYKHVLSQENQERLKTIYQQMYPNKTIKFFPCIYEECKRAIIGDEIVSSVRNKEDHQGVIVAYWPSTGSTLANVDYTQFNIGLIQHFVKHSITLFDNSNREVTDQHLFCYIRWKQRHPNANWFGRSAVLTDKLNEVESACCYMPIQRIVHRCASGNITVDFGLHSESILVAVPLGTKCCF